MNFTDFIQKYKNKLSSLFEDLSQEEDPLHQRGLSPRIMDELAEFSPSAFSIPTVHGGRGGDPAEILSLLEATSYESLPLSLIFGINGALFLEPLAKYGDERLKKDTFGRFIGGPSLGGLMITEPNHGTDALAMQTNWRKSDTGYAIEGTKHWAGLSGHADFWLMTARERRSQSDLRRDIDFFVCDSSDPMQLVKPIEQYSNLGLYMIPYARNQVNVNVPAHHRLIPHKSGIRLMQDLLHRSRMRFAGMALGFLQRMMDEAVRHTQDRYVGGSSLFSYDQVQQRLSSLQADHTIASAFCRHSAQISSIDNDLSGKAMEANIHKTVLSDMMQNAAQSLLQLVGAKGYKTDHLAGRSVVDSRPFQIFEGSNDVIYQQVADGFLKHMKSINNFHLFSALQSHHLSERIAGSLKAITNFTVNPNMPQRKKVDFGRIFSRITGLDLALDLGNRGFDQALINQAVDSMSERIQSLLGGFLGIHTPNYIPVEAGGSSSWRETL